MSITSANSIVTLGVVGLFSTPQQFRNFATDDIFDVDQIALAVTEMGVDGFLSGGFVYEKVPQTFTFKGDSATIPNVLYPLIQQTFAQQEALLCNMEVVLRGTGIKYTMATGYLVKYPPLPSLGKTIKPQKFMFEWESAVPSPI